MRKISNIIFFEEVGNGKSIDETPKADIAEFIKKAVSDGFPESSVLDFANTNPEANDYSEFVDALVKYLKDPVVSTENINKVRDTAISLAVADVRNTPDIESKLLSRIKNEYNTSAIDLYLFEKVLRKLLSSEEIAIYESPIYYAYLNIRSNAVKDAVHTCNQSWTINAPIKDFVKIFLEERNLDTSDMNAAMNDLVALLPSSFQEEDSPLEYKAYKAVELLLDKNAPTFEMTEDNIVDLGANIENFYEDGMPMEAAETIASNEAHKGILASTSGVVGSLVGKTISIKYNVQNSFNDALNDSLGPFADSYKAKREEVAKRKEELRLRKLEQEAEEQKKSAQQVVQEGINQQQKFMQQMYYNQQVDPRRQGVYNQTQYPYGIWQQQNTQQRKVDISPRIPIKFILSGVHILLALLLFLLRNLFGYVLPIGLCIAGVGFSLKPKEGAPKTENSNDYIRFIVIGYLVFVLGIVMIIWR